MMPSHIHLPTAYSTFVGRNREVAQIGELLTRTRLLTLTGPGGGGKTRLALQTAIQVASEYSDGVYWCDLTSVSDPAYVPQSIAVILGSPEQPHRSATEAIVEFIQEQRLLVILDNCEQVLDACAALASAILATCPNVELLATSLQPLGLPQEIAWQVPPLALADANTPLDTLGEYDSIRLFVARATGAFPAFALDQQNAPLVAAICRRLDGLPLAIELAAARVRVLTVEQIAERLDQAFGLLTRGRFDTVPRHQTLRATMDWTYPFLTEAEQTLLRRLSVFAGPFMLDMIEAVCADEGDAGTRGRGDTETPSIAASPFRRVTVSSHDILDLLAGLVEKSFVSLLPREGRTEAGYRLLEVIRQYAREKLEDSGEAGVMRNRYLDWCVAWAEQAEPHLTKPEQSIWLKEFESRLEHFRAALRWACTNHRVEQGLRLGNALMRFWMTGDMADGRAWLEELLHLETLLRQSGSSEVSANTRAWALCMSGRLAVRQGDDQHGARRGEESLALFRKTGDQTGLLCALNLLALVSQDTSDYPRAMALYEEALSLSRETNNARMTCVLLSNQGLMYYEQQDYRRAAPLWEEANAIAERLNFYTSLDNLGCLAMMQGDLARAHKILEREWQVASETGDKHAVALAMMDLGETARRQGNLDRAQTLLRQALASHQQMSNPTRIGETLVYLAHVARNRGLDQDAQNLYESSLPFLEKSNYTRYISQVKINLGLLEALHGRGEQALPLLREGLRMAQKGNHRLCRIEALEEITGVWAREGNAKRAARVLAVTRVERGAIGAPVPPVESERYDQTVEGLRAALGDDAIGAIEMEARTLTLEQVVAEALGEELPTPAPTVVAVQEPVLRIFAMGATRVVVGERVLTPANWKYAKSKELFFYLLSNPPVTKAQIGLDLWPDASPEQLRNIFHRVMYYMRKALGHPEWILFEGDGYVFDRRINYWCDLHEFEARLKEAQSLLRPPPLLPPVRAGAIQILEEAVRLWRSDFLQDMDAGEWAILKRETLRQAFLRALLDLGLLYFANARHADAVTTFERVLSFDEYLELAHRELMRSYARQGDAARALRHFNDLRRLMRMELGAEPSAETLLLYDRLRRGDDV